MKLIYTSQNLWKAFNALTSAAQKARAGSSLVTGRVPLMQAAVTFTGQLAIDAAAGDQTEMQALAHDLRTKLASWHDDDGGVKLRLMTHDMECVIGALARAANRYACPPQVSNATLTHAVESLQRDLVVAAVVFTSQFAIEEMGRNATEMFSLECALRRALEIPWEFGSITLKVDVQDGRPWGSAPSEED